MAQAASVFQELETALKSSSTEKHIEILRRVTDLFLSSHDTVTKEVTGLFDDIMIKLVDHIENRAIVELSTQLAPVRNPPPNVLRRLAGDDKIEVAGPVLSRSPGLTDQQLVEIAESKGQPHLSKIAERPTLSTKVTDVLVDRGDREVVHKVAANEGARFSTMGMSMLVMRANGDDELATAVGRRGDVPPAMFKQLLSQATEQVRERLLSAAKPEQKDSINRILAQISSQIGEKAGPRKDFSAAERLVHSFSQDTALTKSKVLEFADGARIEELVAALSILSGIRIDLIGQLVCDTDAFGAMVVCKAIRLEWSVAHSVLTAAPGAGATRAAQLEELCDEYDKLSPASAQRLLGFWQARQKPPAVKPAAAKPAPMLRRA
ncbi:MAG TPA: DUF2336 domain-containing protein [Pseudolabrys sp.]|jgi:uncharacterized protein (DUF2336 family)|nr:DUF2336 domain-containing protein [Pseudolabrys sp.]